MASNDATKLFEALTFGRVALYTLLGTPRARVHAFYGYAMAEGLSVPQYKCALIELRAYALGARDGMPASVNTDAIVNALDSELMYWSDDSGYAAR